MGSLNVFEMWFRENKLIRPMLIRFSDESNPPDGVAEWVSVAEIREKMRY